MTGQYPDKCPHCDGFTDVISDWRAAVKIRSGRTKRAALRRRRKCKKCGLAYTTAEVYIPSRPATERQKTA